MMRPKIQIILMHLDRIEQELAPFGVRLSANHSALVGAYLKLLMKWNRRINLTGVKSAEECLRLHFGESLVLLNHVAVEGPLLDIGSGAGFPGLALKIFLPELPVTLLEPSTKKRAFLQEVARTLNLQGVEVSAARWEKLFSQAQCPAFKTVTTRALGGQEAMAERSDSVLAPGGKFCLWTNRSRQQEIFSRWDRFEWQEPIPIPGTRERIILVGAKTRFT